MTKVNSKAVLLIALVLMVACIGVTIADTGVPAEPQVQGLTTMTSSNVVGTVTETDSGAWSVNANGIPLSGDDPILASFPDWANTEFESYSNFLRIWHDYQDVNPTGNLADFLTYWINPPVPFPKSNAILTWLENQGSPLTPPLQTGEVQYTAGYNDQYSGVSGQQTFTKSVGVSTANTIADQSNIKANTNIQYIAVDTGRATRSEDLLLDGASLEQNSSNEILCPFANANPGIIPASCNIEQAGSAFDTTLTSTVTSADTRFVGTDATIPTALNYNINAEGVTAGNQSSPMIGSVSAYLKVHVQEARNETEQTPGFFNPPYDDYITHPPVKSQDLVYSETSSASGLISKFSKSMSYSSQASAVPVPVLTPLPGL